MQKYPLAIIIVFTVVSFSIDQISKWFVLNLVMDPPRVIEILPFFNLTLGFNTGVSFGMFNEIFATKPWLLALLTLGVVLGVFVWAYRSHSNTERMGLSLVAGGALGNIVDRLRQGGVTDFLDFHWNDLHWPTFNGADILIFTGVLLYLIMSFRREQNNETE